MPIARLGVWAQVADPSGTRTADTWLGKASSSHHKAQNRAKERSEALETHDFRHQTMKKGRNNYNHLQKTLRKRPEEGGLPIRGPSGEAGTA